MTKRKNATRSAIRGVALRTVVLSTPTHLDVRDEWSRLIPTLALLRSDIAHLFAEFGNLTPEQVKLLKNKIEATS